MTGCVSFGERWLCLVAMVKRSGEGGEGGVEERERVSGLSACGCGPFLLAGRLMNTGDRR